MGVLIMHIYIYFLVDPSFGCSCEHDASYIQLTFQGIGLFFFFPYSMPVCI